MGWSLAFKSISTQHFSPFKRAAPRGGSKSLLQEETPLEASSWIRLLEPLLGDQNYRFADRKKCKNRVQFHGCRRPWGSGPSANAEMYSFFWRGRGGRIFFYTDVTNMGRGLALSWCYFI